MHCCVCGQNTNAVFGFSRVPRLQGHFRCPRPLIPHFWNFCILCDPLVAHIKDLYQESFLQNNKLREYCILEEATPPIGSPISTIIYVDLTMFVHVYAVWMTQHIGQSVLWFLRCVSFYRPSSLIRHKLLCMYRASREEFTFKILYSKNCTFEEFSLKCKF